MKKLLGFVFGLTLLIATVAPTAAAHPLASRHVATDAYPCETTTFIEKTGAFQWFNPSGAQFKLQANLWVEVDPTRSNLYCGQVQTEGVDQLANGCVTFQGNTRESATGTNVSFYTVYHCTATTYTFWGSVSALTCPSGGGITSGAYVGEYPGDTMISQSFFC